MVLFYFAMIRTYLKYNIEYKEEHMNKKENKLFLVFQKYFKTLLPGRTLVLHEIDTNIEKDIGYTSYTGRVCNMSLALKHPIMEGLSAKERTLLITGVFAHETLHQIFTDFHYANITLAKYNRQEAQIILAFANYLEDAGIEFWAPTVLGDDLLNALDYSIKVIYEKSRPINEEESAFAQLNAALIQFGDLGIVKGEFTYPEAKTYFDKIAPLFNDGIKEPISSKRIDYAVTFMEMTRPLWEREAKEQEKFQKALNEMLRQMLVNLANGNSSPEKNGDGTDASNNGSDSNDESGDNANGNSCSSSSGDGTGSENSNSDNNSDGNSDENADSDAVKSIKAASQNRKNQADARDNAASNIKEGNSVTSDNTSEIAAELESCISVDPSAADSIKDTLERIEKRLEKEAKNNSLDFEVDSAVLKASTCKNIKVASDSKAVVRYNSIVRENKKTITAVANAIERICRKEPEETLHHTSGHYNIKRANCKVTAKLFDKKKEPGDKKDISALLLIDESGSMFGQKIDTAQKMAIIYAEVFERLHIPYCIIGFTADTQGVDALHEHFVTFNGDSSEKYSLAKMSAIANNLDGYSIRYAGEILKRTPSSRKLLLVASDGQPAAVKYHGHNGIKDTTDAIKEVRKYASVFGFGIGNCPTEILHKMYGKDYIHVEDVNSLTGIFIRKIKKIIGGND